ncbi:hypothetical protein [Alloyangia pacifica]|uniref:Metal-dependent hydrolase n=1 Tax=Alloyangia pacifica TaxID=311180 RepID=A0A1I6WEG3_9RHOB|nr:hypothetical protein [Alloyangia pacifica]SDI62847.1 hypothetical protein SAMN04488245_12034 [Alloyangia pacifica]SFT24383.1 hypothetical protein SAMN04488050_11935 [Alloyangia pacifica]
MPNTLAHLGIQTLVSRGVFRDADVKWVWLACIVPDLPWIAQRMIRAAWPGVDMIDLRLYAIVQSSLLFCLVLCAGLACFSRWRWRTFGLLAAGSMMHLLLDALQLKWANGVVLFAPFRWELVNFGLFWPEDLTTTLFTLLGVAVAGVAFCRLPKIGSDLRLPGPGLALLASGALAVYIVGPICFSRAVEMADLHYTRTLRQAEVRENMPVEVDRGRIVATPEGSELLLWTGERIALNGLLEGTEGVFSLRGHFSARDAIAVDATHRHRAGIRDYASYAGLLLVVAWWLVCIGRWASARGRAKVTS